MLDAVLLLALGLALAAAEVFVVSLGALSLLAGVAIVAADVIAFRESPALGWAFVAAEVVLVPLVVTLAFRALPRVPFARRMLLPAPPAPPRPGVPDHARLLGRRGEALTDLRPAGAAAIGDERVSVVALGELLAQGTRIEVVEVDGSEVRVRAVRAPEPTRRG